MLQEFAAEIRDKHASDAKQRADDAAKEAAEAAKEAKRTEEAAKAAKKPSEEEASQQPAADPKTTPAEPAAAPVEPVKVPATAPKERIEGKSRSPPPSKNRFSSGDSSASTAGTPRPKAVEAALAKRAGDRTAEENLLAASAAKAAKKDSWADTTEADMADDSQ